MTDTAEILRAIDEALPTLAANGGEYDRAGDDPADNVAVLSRIGAGRLLVPSEFGGVAWDAGSVSGIGADIRAYTAVATGDRSSELSAWTQDYNTGHRTIRARVEHALARLKTYKILRGNLSIPIAQCRRALL